MAHIDENFHKWFVSVTGNQQHCAVDKILICFPGAGLPNTSFSHWKNICSQELHVYTACFPGRGRRSDETFVTDYKMLTKEIAGAITSVKGPKFSFLGDCSGSAIALGVAEELEYEHGLLLESLYVGGYPYPPSLIGHVKFEEMTEEERRLMIVRHGFLDPEILQDDSAVDFFSQQIIEDIILAEKYEPRGRVLTCPLTCFLGAGDNTRDFKTIGDWKHATAADFSLLSVELQHLLCEDSLFEVRAHIRKKLSDSPR